MKLSYKQIEPFVQKPDSAARVILVYGPDSGLMKERAQIMGKTVVPDLSDPFNVVVLSTDGLTEDPARLSDEANAISMMGGNRLIRIEDASDKLTQLIKSYLENPSTENLVILEAGELGPRSALRKLCESAKNAAAVPCYVENEQDLGRLIRATLHENNLQIDQDAAIWLAVNISGDRQKARRELEKIITYKWNDRTPVTLADVEACCGEAGAKSLDDLVYATASRNPKKALETYDTLLEEGINFITIVRSLQNHFKRLHLTQARMQSGEHPDRVVKMLSPPVFFKLEPQFKNQISSWNTRTIEKILLRLNDLEEQCKQTGIPVESLCAQAILSISAMR